MHDGENGRLVPAAPVRVSSPRQSSRSSRTTARCGAGAERMGRACTTEGMVPRFVDGIERALAAPPREPR